MNKPIQYSNESLKDIEFIPELLSSTEQLALKKQNTKVTIALTPKSVEEKLKQTKETSRV